MLQKKREHGLYKEEELELKELQNKRDALSKNEFVKTIKLGSELHDKLEMIEQSQALVDSVKYTIRNEEDLDYVYDMVNNYNMNQIDGSTLDSFKELSQEILSDSIKEGLDFETVLKNVVKNQFVKQLEHVKEHVNER